MRSAAGWLALAALGFFPLAADHFELPHQAVLALGVAVLALSAGRYRVSRTFVAVMLAWLGVAALTTLTSRAPALSAPALLTLAVVWSLGLFATPEADVTLRPVLWTVWPLAAWALAQALGRDPFEWSEVARWCGGMRPFATLGHPTQLGVWMAAMAVLALDDARRSRWSFFTAVVAALTCFATLSRAGWLALGVGVAVLAWTSRAWRLDRLLPAALGVVGLAALVAGPRALLERVTHFFVAPTRVQMWATALAGAREHPWLGHGFETFLLVDQQHRHPDAWRYEWGGTAGHAHSIVPQTLATEGLLGLLVLLGCVALVLTGWRRAGRRDAGPRAVVVALAAASLVSFSGVLVAALGVVCLARSLPAGRSGRTPAALAFLAPWLAALTLTQLGGSMALRRAHVVEHDAERWLWAARKLSPLEAGFAAQHGAWLEARGRLDEARAAYERARQLVPDAAVFAANVGRVAAKLKDGDGSRRAFDAARRHAPLDGRIALDAAEASLELGDLELAEATLRSLLALYPADGPAWWALARLRLSQGRLVETRAALEASLDADWRDWPEGLGHARAALVRLVGATGDPQLAAALAHGPMEFAAPADICGAPGLLAR